VDTPRDFGSGQTSTASELQLRLQTSRPPAMGTSGGRVVHTRAMNRRRDSDRIGFRCTASAEHPDHEAPTRHDFGHVEARCPGRDTHPHHRLGGGAGRNGAHLDRQPDGATRRARNRKTPRQTGSVGATKDLGKERSPGRSGSSTHRKRRGAKPDPTMEQGLEADAPDPPTSTDLDLRQRNQARRGGDRARTAGGQRTRRRVPAIGGEFFGGYGPASRESSGSRGLRPGHRTAETRWTPGSAAGCNKPATREAEEAVEVVRNHEDGTGLRGWNPRGRSDDWPSSREWTQHEHVDGGATGTSPSSRGADVWTEPKREGRQNRPGRSVWLRSGAKVRRFARAVPFGGTNGRTGSGTLEDEPGNGRTSRRARERPTTRSATRTGQVHAHRKMSWRHDLEHPVNHRGAATMEIVASRSNRKALGSRI